MNIKKIINEYLKTFPNEAERLNNFLYFIDSHTNEEMIDWNNFEGHIVASGFVYAKEEKKFLVLYHNDLKMYVYPGGHMEQNDNSPESAAKREVIEETGLKNIENYILNEDILIPLDIDTHTIRKNERLNLPPHYHFDFRYLYFIDKITKVMIDNNESRDYKWIDIEDLQKITNCEYIIPKIKKIINNN